MRNVRTNRRMGQAEHVVLKSDSAFRQRSLHTAEGAGKKPPAFPPYVLRIRRGQP